MIEVRNVWKEYGDQVVLERLNLTVKEGEFCSMVGASGCGKSTFLRLLLGQERATRGEILLDGKPLPAEPDRHRGVVFQRYSVFDHLSVLRNVMLGLELPQAKFTGRLFGARRRVAQDEAAAMQGLSLNRDLLARRARLLQATQTAAQYRLSALPASADGTRRPGLWRVTDGGAKIAVEVWEMPSAEFGSFISTVPSPLVLGKVELVDGSWVSGFLCEPYGVQSGTDISEFGGWRACVCVSTVGTTPNAADNATPLIDAA